MSRYKVPSSEDYQPGSDNVLINYLNIISKKEIEALESSELKRTELELLDIYDQDHRFTSEDISNIHELWLGDIYPFAGKYRTVSMEKDGFPFANPNLIASLMVKFEHDYLKKYTPCHYPDIKTLAEALGIVHVELILIHPFREGNGRLARLLSNLMVLQAGKPPLDFTAISQTENIEGFGKYISAIHKGHVGDYIPIQLIFEDLLERSRVSI